MHINGKWFLKFVSDIHQSVIFKCLNKNIYSRSCLVFLQLWAAALHCGRTLERHAQKQQPVSTVIISTVLTQLLNIIGIFLEGGLCRLTVNTLEGFTFKTLVLLFRKQRAFTLFAQTLRFLPESPRPWTAGRREWPASVPRGSGSSVPEPHCDRDKDVHSVCVCKPGHVQSELRRQKRNEGDSKWMASFCFSL